MQETKTTPVPEQVPEVKKPRSTRPPKPPTAGLNLDITEPPTQIPPVEDIPPLERALSPSQILQQVNLNQELIDDEDLDREFNPKAESNGFVNPLPVNDEENLLGNIQQRRHIPLEAPPVIASPVRKVAIKKIKRFNNRLGLELLPEDTQLMPGVGHNWMPDKVGNEFLTGLEDLPSERARLEKKLRVDLSPTSPYWETLVFRLEDKHHGQILNFDDTALGPYYEVVYHAMLASSLVANGLQEYKNGSKPTAEWYIENKEAEAELRQAEMTQEKNAFVGFDMISDAKAQDIAKLVGLPVWGLSPKASRMELWDWLKKGGVQKDTAMTSKTFNELASMADPRFNVFVLVRSALKFNVIRRNRANEYVFVNETLGPTEDHIINRLSQAPAATLRLSIEKEVAAKMRG